MSESVISLVPGHLVVVSTRIEGGVRYAKVDLDAPADAQEAAPDAEVRRWETTRTVARPEEFKEAGRVRALARKLVLDVCIPTPFGFSICPTERAATLETKKLEAKEAVRQFNLTAVESRLRIVVMEGEIAQSQEEAAAAIQGDVGVLLRDLEAAISAGQVTTIRDLSDQLRDRGKLIESKSTAKGALDQAVAAARKIARDVKRAVATGESVADILEQAQTRPVSVARFIFAETPEEAEALRAAVEGDEPDGQEILPQVSLQRFAGLDAGDGEDVEVAEAPRQSQIRIIPDVEPEGVGGEEF